MDDIEQSLQTGFDGFDEGEGRPRWAPPPRVFDQVAREIEEIRRERGDSGCTLVFEYIPKPEDIDSALREIHPDLSGGEMFAWLIPHQRMLPKPPGLGNQYTVIRNISNGSEHVTDDSIRIYYFQPDQPLLES